MADILVYSHTEFDMLCYKNGWNDDNVELLNDKAFISIIGTDNCLKHYLEEEAYHWFKQNHSNVLNIEFDDISREENVFYKGYELKSLDLSLSERCLDFIEANIGKTFIIHCRAGKSRSQAFYRFIVDCYSDIYNNDCGNKNNPCITPNQHVVRMLKRAYYNKHGMFQE